MASFTYVARETDTGQEVQSTMEAASQQAALLALFNRNLLVISIQEEVGKKGRDDLGKVSLVDLVVFTRQLATMVDAGLALVRSLRALSDQAKSKVLRDVLKDVCTRVEGGDSLSEALQRHPNTFNQLYISMVSAGERGGLLAEILDRLATYLENTERLRKKVKAALIYPITVTVVAILITAFLLIKVVPVFDDIYTSFGSKLPAPTLFLVHVSETIRRYFVLILLVGGAAIYGWTHFIRTRAGREFWDSRRIRLPIFGPIAHEICLARFTRTMASLVRSGVPILDVLRIVSKTVDNVVMEKAIQVAGEDIEQGESISGAMSKHPIFPDMVIRMMTAGEETGKIDDMLERVSDFLDDEIETTLSGLTSLIEPILIVFLGVVIGGMVMCMFLPIFKMAEIVGR
jgi:type IV pilus assembly protein PilC